MWHDFNETQLFFLKFMGMKHFIETLLDFIQTLYHFNS